jgi:rubrerythrin
VSKGGKKMNKKEQTKPLLVALKAEKEAYNFYARMAKRSSNPTGQVMFNRLAKEEKKHIKLIEQRLGKIKIYPEIAGITGKASVLSETDFADPALSDLEIVEQAIKDEKHAYAFYTQAAKESDVPDEEEMYTVLADDEKEHIHVLEKEALHLK